MSPEGVGGWWMASDGRWYPPEQHPDYVPPSPPPAAPPTPPNSAPPMASASASTTQRPGFGVPPRSTPADGGYYGTAAPRSSIPGPLPSSPPKKRRGRYDRPAGSGIWVFIVIVVLVIVGVVGAVAAISLSGNKSDSLPKATLPKLPTVSTTTTTGNPGSEGLAPGVGSPGATFGVGGTSLSSTGGPSSAPVSPAPASSPAPAASPPPSSTPTSPSPAPSGGGGGCTKDPNGSCISAGQPCDSSWAGQSYSGSGGTFTCAEKKAISNGGGALPLGYFWQSG